MACDNTHDGLVGWQNCLYDVSVDKDESTTPPGEEPNPWAFCTCLPLLCVIGCLDCIDCMDGRACRHGKRSRPQSRAQKLAKIRETEQPVPVFGMKYQPPVPEPENNSIVPSRNDAGLGGSEKSAGSIVGVSDCSSQNGDVTTRTATEEGSYGAESGLVPDNASIISTRDSTRSTKDHLEMRSTPSVSLVSLNQPSDSFTGSGTDVQPSVRLPTIMLSTVTSDGESKKTEVLFDGNSSAKSLNGDLQER